MTEANQTAAGVGIPAGATPVDPRFPVPYTNAESAWRDAGFFAHRRGRVVHVHRRGGWYWLSYEPERTQ
jgi:hypothetical protein